MTSLQNKIRKTCPAKLIAHLIGCWTGEGLQVQTPPMLSYLDLVQLASESSDCEGRPYCDTWVHAPTAAALYVLQGIEFGLNRLNDQVYNPLSNVVKDFTLL